MALQCYAQWLDQHGTSPLAAPIWFNRGVLLSSLDRREESATCYRVALGLVPNFWQAAANLANYFERCLQPESAIIELQRMLAFTLPVDGATFIHNHLGRLYEDQRDFGRAMTHYQASLDQQPDQPDTFQHLFHLRQKTCSWPLTITPVPLTMDQWASRLGSLSAMAYFDDVGLVRRACEAWYERFRAKQPVVRLPPAPAYRHDRLRVGYVSGDFRMHAVGFLIAELFEHHDRARFEVIGFDFSTTDSSPWRARMLRGMDRCHAIHTLTDEQAAQLMRSEEIDILVDLMGPTANARPGIFMCKPAALQVSYLGFLGPNVIPEIDYLVCDQYVVPPETEAQYGAVALRVPFYQINNRLRIASDPPSRSSQGLPDEAFVFCALNNSYKITPEVFDRWMQILKSVPNTVLWLLEENDFVRQRLLREGAKYGVGQDRLIFAKPVPPHEYLARFCCADLFLDTSPYNAGITASDALWMGLPVLTCPGKTYTSRMAADLLLQLNLPQFVAASWADYVQKAVVFALTRAARGLLDRERVRGSQVFDSRYFVRHLEARYQEILS